MLNTVVIITIMVFVIEILQSVLSGKHTHFKQHTHEIKRYSLGNQNIHKLWFTKDGVFITTRSGLIFRDVNDLTEASDVIQWSIKVTKSRQNAHIFLMQLAEAYATQLFKNIYEICGPINGFLKCLFYIKNVTWNIIPGTEKLSPFGIGHCVKTFADGYQLAIHQTKSEPKPVLQLKMLFQQELIGLTVVSRNQSSQPIYRWAGAIETDNSDGRYFAEATRFQGVVVAPGRRYLIFTEKAEEAVRLDTVWSTQPLITQPTVYTRIARVCTGDPGYRRPSDGRLLISSFFKTRLLCPLSIGHPGEPGRPTRSRSQIRMEFNNLQLTTSGWSSSGRRQPIIFGIFSQLEATPADWLFGPSEGLLAVCVYQLTEIDRVIGSSDLIKLIPGERLKDNPILHDNRSAHEMADQSWEARSCSSGTITRHIPWYKRIARSHTEEMDAITECPGPSAKMRRLALEVPLLADAVLPWGGQASGLLLPNQIVGGVTVLLADPRYIARSSAIPSENQPDGVHFSVFYLATGKGYIFKLLVLTREKSSGWVPKAQSRPSHLLQAFGDVHVIGHLLKTEPTGEPVETMRLRRMDSRSGASMSRFLPLHQPVQADELRVDGLRLVAAGKRWLYEVPVVNCSPAKTCSSCVALRDPDCSWDSNTRRCSTLITRVNNIFSGVHSDCRTDMETVSNQPEKPETLTAVTTNLPGPGIQLGAVLQANHIWSLEPVVLVGAFGVLIGSLVGFLLASFCLSVYWLRRRHRSNARYTCHTPPSHLTSRPNNCPPACTSEFHPFNDSRSTVKGITGPKEEIILAVSSAHDRMEHSFICLRNNLDVQTPKHSPSRIANQ